MWCVCGISDSCGLCGLIWCMCVFVLVWFSCVCVVCILGVFWIIFSISFCGGNEVFVSVLFVVIDCVNVVGVVSVLVSVRVSSMCFMLVFLLF